VLEVPDPMCADPVVERRMTQSGTEGVFTAKKIRRYALLSLGLTLVGYVTRILINHDVVGGLSRDFMCFWSVSKLSLQGEAASAFDFGVLAPLQRSIGSGDTFYTWSYPPTFQLLILPLAYVSPLVSQFVWGAAGTFTMVVALRRILPQRQVVLVVISTSLFITNLCLGQIGIWIAALYLLGIASLLKSDAAIPWGAAAFGLAVIKPHLGLMIPVMLLIKKQWAAFAVAALAAITLVLASLVVFGFSLWQLFFEMAGTTMQQLGDAGYKSHLLTSFFSTLQSLGMPREVAYGLHGLFVVGLCVGTIRMLMKCSDTLLAAGLATTAGLLIFPYTYYYDLMLLLPAMAVLVRHALETDWLPRERELLVAIWLGPIPLLIIMEELDLSLGVIFPILALGLLIRRIEAFPEPKPAVQASGSPAG
jgi:hypothetical protein